MRALKPMVMGFVVFMMTMGLFAMTGAVQAEPAMELSAKDKAEIYTQAEDTLTCATAIRQSFPPYDVIKMKGAEGKEVEIKLHAVAYQVFLTAVEMYKAYDEKFTKDDVDNLWADKNTVWLTLPQDLKDDILAACGEMLSPGAEKEEHHDDV